jgi:hypothetical protein
MRMYDPGTFHLTKKGGRYVWTDDGTRLIPRSWISARLRMLWQEMRNLTLPRGARR